MPWRFQRRIRLHKGLGINLGKRSGSISARSRGGSWGTKGYSLKTGVTGLSYRQRWHGSNAGVGMLLVLAAVVVAVAALGKGVIWVWRKINDARRTDR